MKKLSALLFATIFSICSFTSANAITIGLSLTEAAMGGQGKETNTTTVTEEYGAFTDSYPGIFVEVDTGTITLGFEYAMEGMSTPTNTNVQMDGSTGGAEPPTTGGSEVTNTVRAEFENLMSVYAMIPTPLDGLYGKVGVSTVEMNSIENLGTGGSYGNTDTMGVSLGLGYELDGDAAFMRIEVAATSWDDISVNNTTDSTKVISVTDMLSANATVKIGKRF